MTEDSTRELGYRVLDAGALKALAHPLRVKLFDLLSERGPQTASTLAELTGESSGATSYHLRALARHDLIREVAGRGSARERWWERPPGGITLHNDEVMKTPSGRAATQVVTTETLNRRHAQLMEHVARGFRDGADPMWDPGSLISTATTRLTPGQAAELVQRLEDIVSEYVTAYRGQTGPDVRPISIRTDVIPLDPSPAHDGAPAHDRRA